MFLPQVFLLKRRVHPQPDWWFLGELTFRRFYRILDALIALCQSTLTLSASLWLQVAVCGHALLLQLPRAHHRG